MPSLFILINMLKRHFVDYAKAIINIQLCKIVNVPAPEVQSKAALAHAPILVPSLKLQSLEFVPV